MASTITADNGVTSGSAGIKTSADSTGVLALQTTTAGGTATTAVTVDNSQNVGVGVTPSAWGGSFKAIEFSGGNSMYSAGDRAALSGNAYYNGSAWTYKTTGGASRFEMVNNQFSFYNAASGTAGNAISFTQAMTLDASGNLGIGATSPSAKLHVSGAAIKVDGSSTATINLNGSSYGMVSASADLYVETAGAGNQVIFRRGGTESARIDSSGNLLVGVTSYSDGNMFYKASNTALNCWRGTTSAGDGIFGSFSNIGGTQTVRAYFKADGGLANYSANNVNLSDENLKKDISLAGSYLAKICAIPVKNFRYKDQSESEDITLGVIAQDVLAVAPELVSQEGFGMDEESKQNYLSVYQTDLQYALMKCIQEQQALITQLQADVAALKAPQ